MQLRYLTLLGATCVVAVVAVAATDGARGPFQNMNGEYLTSPTPNAPTGQKFNTQWSEYPGGVEYFEAYM